VKGVILMARYESGDIVTYYFVVMDNGDHSRIVGWSDNKMLVKYYMEFHKCKYHKLKVMTKPIEEINKILNENINDEIMIAKLFVKDPNHRKGEEERKMISVPVTTTEMQLINSEEQSFMMSMINYSYMNGVIPYLKPKYQEILEDIFLTDVVKFTCHNIQSKFTSSVKFDQLMVMFRLLPDHFGE
jgi:hypothetical protein